MKKQPENSRKAGAVQGAHPQATEPSLWQLHGVQQEHYEEYLACRVLESDSPEAAAAKQERAAEIVRWYLRKNKELIELQAGITHPVIVLRRLDDLNATARYEVIPYAIDRAAPIGSPQHLCADRALGEILPGDIAIVGPGGILDIDFGTMRAGENAVVRHVAAAGEEYRYEIEIEGDGPGDGRRMRAKAWARLDKEPRVGDRVCVMGGIIHAVLGARSEYRFKKIWRDDLESSHLHGAAQQQALNFILCEIFRHKNPQSFLPRSRTLSNGANTIGLFGKAGVGKTWTITVAFSEIQRRHNSNGQGETVAFFTLDGAAVEEGIVGSGPKNLRSLRDEMLTAQSQGLFPIAYLAESDSLLRSREKQAQMHDGGSSLSTHSQLLTLLSGAEPFPGLVIFDGNMPEIADEATRQRIISLHIPRVDCALLMKMFRGAYDREAELYEDEWTTVADAIAQGFDTVVGDVRVGAATLPVTVGHLTSGRLYENVLRFALTLSDLTTWRAIEHGYEAPFSRLSAALIYYALVRRAHGLYAQWDESEARGSLADAGLVSADKAGAISSPRSLPWEQVAMPTALDLRTILETEETPALEEVLGA